MLAPAWANSLKGTASSRPKGALLGSTNPGGSYLPRRCLTGAGAGVVRHG
jgi:hypothetical protein